MGGGSRHPSTRHVVFLWLMVVFRQNFRRAATSVVVGETMLVRAQTLGQDGPILGRSGER